MHKAAVFKLAIMSPTVCFFVWCNQRLIDIGSAGSRGVQGDCLCIHGTLTLPVTLLLICS